jgi:hypothetical protein
MGPLAQCCGKLQLLAQHKLKKGYALYIGHAMGHL